MGQKRKFKKAVRSRDTVELVTLPGHKLPLKPAGPPPKKAFNAETMCGAQLRRRERGRLCQLAKGYKTPHPDQGKCWLHGGLTPIKHGLGSLITHGRLKDLIRKVQELDHAVMDLEPEALLMRAMVIDFVNRYDEFRDHLETWYDALDSKNHDDGLPPVSRRYPELEDAAKLLEGVSRIVERMHKITREGSITLDVFRATMTQMGMSVAKHVADETLLAAIEKEWSLIMVDPKSFIRGRQETAEQTDDEEDDN